MGGKVRDYPLSKATTRFAHYADVRLYLDAAAYDLRHSNDIRTPDRRRFAAGMADIFAHINTAHPFREGNGRTSREFLTEAAEEFSRYRLDFTRISPDEWNAASRNSDPPVGRFPPDPSPLIPLFERAAKDPQE